MSNIEKIDPIVRVERMLKALLRSRKLLAWVGGYAHGRTSNDDPFIVLYPPEEWLEHQVCRVYDKDFKRLPGFVNTAVPPTAPDQPGDKSKLVKRGLFFPCPLFCVALYEGKETQMGPDKRFSDVIYITDKMAEARSRPVDDQQQEQQEQLQPEQAAIGFRKEADVFVFDGRSYRLNQRVWVQGNERKAPGVLKHFSPGNDYVSVEVDGKLMTIHAGRLAGTGNGAYQE